MTGYCWKWHLITVGWCCLNSPLGSRPGVSPRTSHSLDSAGPHPSCALLLCYAPSCLRWFLSPQVVSRRKKQRTIIKAVNKGSWPLYVLGAEALPTLMQVTTSDFSSPVLFGNAGWKPFHLFSCPRGVPVLSPAHWSGPGNWDSFRKTTLPSPPFLKRAFWCFFL